MHRPIRGLVLTACVLAAGAAQAGTEPAGQGDIDSHVQSALDNVLGRALQVRCWKRRFSPSSDSIGRVIRVEREQQC